MHLPGIGPIRRPLNDIQREQRWNSLLLGSASTIVDRDSRNQARLRLSIKSMIADRIDDFSQTEVDDGHGGSAGHGGGGHGHDSRHGHNFKVFFKLFEFSIT